MQFKQNPSWSILGLIASWYFLVISGNLSIDLSRFGTDIPVTLQSLAVLLIGGVMGPYLSLIAVLAYILTGISGYSTFANGAYGMSVLVGTSSGFLIAFLPASFLMGWMNNPKQSTTAGKTALGILLSTCVILALGYLRLLKFLEWDVALYKGILPFLPGALFKGILAFLILNIVNRLIQIRA